MSSSLFAAPRLAPQARVPADDQRRVFQFTAVIIGSALFLQRFGIPLPGKGISIVGPIGLAAAAIGLARGSLALNRGRLIAYLVLVGWALLGMFWQSANPNSYGALPKPESLAQFLLLTAFATLTFARPVDQGRFFRQLNAFMAIVALAGLLQFAAQFAGLRIFQFTGMLPDAVLYESGYNVEIPLGIAGLFKANGFFLVEPSVFSQMMAVALIIEVLILRRVRYLSLFAAGLILSFSGTGWVVLLAFLISALFGMGWRGVAIVVGTLLVLGFAVGAAVLLLPDLSVFLQDRLTEFSTPGTSGHMRFVTPFWLLGDVLKREPGAWLLGIGGGASEHLSLPYDYDVDTPVKILLEYGAPALITYLLLFIVGQKTPVQRAIVFPGIILFLFTGGYQQFPPVLFLVLLIQSVAWLKPSQAGAG